MMRPEIIEYYQRGGERHRLDAGRGRLEFLRTWDVLTRTMPTAPARVLDVGGATGVYAGPLARAGYQVRVVDPVLDHVIVAAELPGVTAVLGDARALPAADDSADVVLLLGPLYHLLDRVERLLAWREAARVVRPGGVVIGAVITRYAVLFDALLKGVLDDPRQRPLTERILADGLHDRDDPDAVGFTSAYFHRPDEVAGEAEAAGLRTRVVAVESPMWMTGPRLDEILADEHSAEVLMDMLRTVESEPSLLGASGHLLAVAHRPA
jgi:SAM-dependent methyltransferase